MGLFKKENCCLCGGKTGMLDKKTADGKICKNCKNKLSIWFDEYKKSSADDLKAQLAQKEEDLKKIYTLEFNKIFGESGVILIDEKNRCFTAIDDTGSSLFGSKRQVKSVDDIIDFRPDIVSFDQIEDLEVDVKEITHEDKMNKDGQQVSYNPPHITYSYSFYLKIIIKDHPYISFMYIPLNNGAINIKNIGRRKWSDPGRRLAAWALDMPGLVYENNAAVYDNDSLLDLLYHSKYEMPAYSYGFKCDRINVKEIKRYHYFLTMAKEIEKIFGK